MLIHFDLHYIICRLLSIHGDTFAFAQYGFVGVFQLFCWSNPVSVTFLVFRFLFVRTPRQPLKNDNNGQNGCSLLCKAYRQFSWKHLKLSGHNLSPFYDRIGGDWIGVMDFI